MAGTGLIDLFGQETTWRLVSLDDGRTLKGQFIPTNVTKDGGANYGQISTQGRPQPILQYLSEVGDSYSYNVFVFARHDGLFGLFKDDIEGITAAIDSLHRVDPDFGRPHIWDFSIGQTDALSATVVVQSTGGVSFERLRPLDGDLRGVLFSFKLLRYEPYDVTLSGRAAESLVLPTRDNESYELAAARVYGSGSTGAGEALRRRNPDKPRLTVGDLIHYPPKPALLTGFLLVPQSPVLERTDVNEANRRAHFALRGAPKVSHVLGPLWDGA